MNYKSIIAVACASAALFAAPIWAQEEVEEANAEEEYEDIAEDEGTRAVVEAQKVEPPVVSTKFKNASKMLKEVMKSKKWKEGWDEEKERLITVAEADFKIKDPQDGDFFAKREMAAKRAVLQAKAQVIEFVNSEMSGKDALDVPGTDVNRELSAEREKVAKAIEAQAARLAALLESTDKAEAVAIRGTTFGQRLDDLLVAAIKKLDEEYNSDKHDEAAKAKYEAAKAEYEAALQDYNELVKKAETLQQEVKSRQTSRVVLMAKMPLFGASVIMQTESWNETKGTYQVAVMLCWSKELERSSRAIISGEVLKIEPGEESVQDWLAKQDLSKMIGPRQYIDDKGNRWFLGISSRQYDDDMNSTARMKYKGLAETFAQQMAVFSLMADVELSKEAMSEVETRGGKGDYDNEVDKIAESYAEKLSQSFEKVNLRGMQKLVGDELEHPISQVGMYVSVYGINSAAAKAADDIKIINTETAAVAKRFSNYLQARNKQLDQYVEDAGKDQAPIKKGISDANEMVKGEQAKRGSSSTKGSPAGNGINAGKTVTPKKRAVGGTHLGDTDVKDNF